LLLPTTFCIFLFWFIYNSLYLIIYKLYYVLVRKMKVTPSYINIQKNKKERTSCLSFFIYIVLINNSFNFINII
ncbi:MAG: hypothetical protein RR697_03435, partial [Malacoplasma sp.]